MTDQTAIRAEFVGCHRVPTRKVIKITLEMAEEHQKQVYDVLGYPCSDKSIWIAVARLTDE